MQFDYPDRETAYTHLQVEIERRGYHARMLGMGGPNDGLVLAVHSFSDHSRSFVVHKRERGWFLRLVEPVYYCIAQNETIVPICLELLTALESTVQADQHALTARLSIDLNLTGMPSEQWFQDDCRERESKWTEYGWTPLHPQHERDVWARFSEWYAGLVRMTDAHVVGYPQYQMWDLSLLAGASKETADRWEAELTLKCLSALNSCSDLGFPLYALDRHHPSYLFDPRLGKPLATRNYWAIPFLPLDNDYFFVAQDYSFGILGTYSPTRFTVFGRQLLAAVMEDVPELLKSVEESK